MKDTLEGIHERISYWVGELGCIKDIECEIINQVATELFEECKDNPEKLKHALINMFFSGQVHKTDV